MAAVVLTAARLWMAGNPSGIATLSIAFGNAKSNNIAFAGEVEEILKSAFFGSALDN